MNLFLDTETWSEVPIRRGLDAYFDGAKCTVLTYARDDGAEQVVDLTQDGIPPNCLTDLADPRIKIICHNVFFDRMCLKRCLNIPLPIQRFHCTQAQALSHGLPGGLGPLCKVLGVPLDEQKDEDGKRLIRKFCGPNPIVKDEDWPLFLDYARQDITAMRAAFHLLPKWNYPENSQLLKLWYIDQEINNRGFAIDRQLADAVIKALATEKEYLDDQTSTMTDGAVTAATQRDKLLAYLCEQQGCVLRDMRAPTIQEALLDESLNEETKELLRVRLQSAKSSVSKFRTLVSAVGKDNRLRGALKFAGANRTARWSGQIFQPQNLARPTMRPEDIRHCVELFRTGQADIVPLFARVNEASSNVLRGLIVAEAGNELLVEDWSSIEGRGLAWSAGESWVLDAFRKGVDLYVETYARAFGVHPTEVSKNDRQVGKVQFLAFGYEGGVGACVNMSAVYGIDLDELGRTVPKSTSEEVLEKAEKTWEWAMLEGKDYGLSRSAYVACDALKIVFRQSRPATVKFWHMLKEAAKSVIREPGTRVSVGHYVFDCNGKWMRVRLPSGHYLSYALPKIHEDETISYMSWRNKAWVRTKTYGGKLAENIVQALCTGAGGLLGAALLRLADRGVPVVLHCHDEVVAEMKQGTMTSEQYRAIITEVPGWARGFPISADGFKGERYEKR